MKAPRIIAHRGASGDAPENTLAAFAMAWAQGADGIECDIRVTADGCAVAIHDADGVRTLGVKARIANLDSAAIREASAGGWKGERWVSERVPTLREVAETVPAGRELVVEIKAGHDAVAASVLSLKNAGFDPMRVTWIAFDQEIAAAAKHSLPGSRALWLCGEHPTPDETEDFAKRLIETTRGGHLDGVDLAFGAHMTRDLVAVLQLAGLVVYTFTVNHSADWDACVAVGVDAVTTDFPARFSRRIF